MDKDAFRVMNIQKKIETCRYNQRWIKIIITLQILIIFLHCRWFPDTILIGWLMSMLLIGVFYYADVFYVKRSKDCEWELYSLHIARQERKKEVARITGNTLLDYEMNEEIPVPSDEIVYPRTYYAVLLALDIAVGIMTIF